MASTSSRSLLKGFLAGAVGGALGTVVLNVFQKGSLEGTRLVEQKLSGSTPYTDQQQQLLDSFEHAHIRTADSIAHAVGTTIPLGKRAGTAPAVEFAFGILCGGVYGALAEYLPAVTAGFGTSYGSVLFTGASELVLPVIGFVPPPSRRTPLQHAGGLAGNVVYGATTEGVRRILRSAL